MTHLFVKAHEGSSRCLHCMLRRGIERWAERSADGMPLVDMSQVIADVANVIGDLTSQLPEGPKREQWEAYARACLEAAFEFARTGVPVEVSTGVPASEH